MYRYYRLLKMTMTREERVELLKLAREAKAKKKTRA